MTSVLQAFQQKIWRYFRWPVFAPLVECCLCHCVPLLSWLSCTTPSLQTWHALIPPPPPSSPINPRQYPCILAGSLVYLFLSLLHTFTDTWTHWFAVWMGPSRYPVVWPWSVPDGDGWGKEWMEWGVSMLDRKHVKWENWKKFKAPIMCLSGKLQTSDDPFWLLISQQKMNRHWVIALFPIWQYNIKATAPPLTPIHC